MTTDKESGTSKAEVVNIEALPTQSSNDEKSEDDQISRADMAANPRQQGRDKTEGGDVKDTKFPEEILGPGFTHIDGDISGTGYNNTTVDVIAVACPGADPVQTWTSDYTPDSYIGPPSSGNLRQLPTVAKLAGDAPLSPAIDRSLTRAGHMWVRQSIRRSASTARVMVYRHRDLVEGVNLEMLARDLLNQIQQQRQGTRPSRPIFFVAHSIGGLVVKLALLLATKLPEYREIKYNCHGVVFFATPHRGSSYLSMKNMKESIQQLLHLKRQIPKSLSDEIRVGHPNLLRMQEEFLDIASELRIWTFYETIDSDLSGSGGGRSSEVQFGAPLVSIKSAYLELRHEDVFAIESDHAHLASFGPENVNTMRTFLEDFSAAILKAQKLSAYIHTPLKLKEHVKVEVIGFYEDPDADMESTIRLYATRYHLGEFLDKGPERCLAERLSRMSRRQGGLTAANSGTGQGGPGGGGMGVWDNVQQAWRASPSDTLDSMQGQTGPGSPDILVTGASSRPSLNLRGRPPLVPSGGERAHGASAPVLPATRSPSPDSDADTASTVSEPAMQLSSIDVVNYSKTDFRESDLTAKQREGLRNAGFVIRDPTAGFSRPDPNLRKFMWIHTPFTNPIWVRNIFDKLSETQNQNFSKLFNYDNWESKHVHGSHSQAQPSYVKPSCSLVTADAAGSPWVPPSFGGRVTPGISPNCLYLYFPYLNFDTYKSIVRRRNLIKRRVSHGRAAPVPQQIADLESLELRVIWEHIGFDPPLNSRRTLDQFGYPSLQDTNARDDDQMLYKLTKQEPSRDPVRPRSLHRSATNAHSVNTGHFSTSSTFGSGDSKEGDGEAESSGDETCYEEETDLRDGNLLMVDNLWLWAIDTTTLATFFPKRESDPREGTLFQQADLRNSVYNELNGDLTGRTENALELAAFIVFHAVTVFLDRSSHPDLEIFRIFEEAIGLLAERMTQNMKHFRLQTFEVMDSEEDGDSEEEPDENSPAAIKRRHKRELERAERENRENTSALLELRDMDDEMAMLLKLFETQESLIKTMKTIYNGKDLNHITSNGQAYLDEALEYLDDYKQQAKEMMKRVDTVRKDYEKMLEMAQRQAQVDEVRWSRVQTELASSQNLSVMIFTTFTVIFLPLSFFTGLFGVNAIEWQDENLPSLKTIGLISLPTSAILIVIALIAAYNWRAQSLVKTVYKHSKRALVGSLSVLARLEPRSRRSKKQRRRAEERRRRRAELARREKDRSYDFWATVKKGRAARYQIPHLNRHSA
ncbi:hypothetical protein QBC47DRAFT_372787 [Echria macrotheca]|uniref:DUF676 domain-containing protein n=1 Tax=Echria macrotheca TaxID=438768 RepID=A0AAJ0BMR5_9PEZI|nr:hypothetical protein QBC47DRAFT_372787 [Echria macrotheca]